MDARTQSSLVGICFLNLSACKLERKKKERSVIYPSTKNMILTNSLSNRNCCMKAFNNFLKNNLWQVKVQTNKKDFLFKGYMLTKSKASLFVA